MTDSIISLSHYLPIITTIISAVFACAILSRYKTKPQAKHLLWWGIGVAVYGGGTLVESLTTLMGWHVILFKSWYILGALLGGAPLALGTMYLFFNRRTGNIAASLTFAAVTVTGVFVLLSPVDYSLVDPSILSSKVLGWQSIRLVSPFINGLAGLVLIGGALYSAGVFFKKPAMRNRSIGNIFIAAGALMPGIGGYLSRIGHTEGLYVGELLGIILIYAGYRYCLRPIAEIRPIESKMPVASDS